MTTETVTIITDDQRVLDIIVADRETFRKVDKTDWEEFEIELAKDDLNDYGVAFIHADSMEVLNRYIDTDIYNFLIDNIHELQ